MGKQSTRRLIGYLPLALLATFLVLVAPLLLVFWLRTSGVVTSVWAGPAIGVTVSFLASCAGATYWKRRKTDPQDLLFSELMLWGWVQRWRSERRLIKAADLLGLSSGRPKPIPDGRLTNEQKAGLLTQLSSGLEARDLYTHGHSRRVARHASNIAKRMGLRREEVAKIRVAGAMHDVGKIDTPIEVLHKAGKLTDDEFAVVKAHPVEGAVMVSALGDAELTAMVRHHHERLDGMGYPDGLAGEAIPLGARILAVADTFDAITSTRSYRHAHAHKKALDILAAESGTQLDPDAVRAFLSAYSGRRPLAYWTILFNGRPRVAAWFGGGLSAAKAATGNLMAAAAAAIAAAAGGLALGPLVEGPVASPPALAATAGSPASANAAADPEPDRSASRPFRRANGGRAGARSGRPPMPRPAAATAPLAQGGRQGRQPGPGTATVPLTAPSESADVPLPAADTGGAPSELGPRQEPGGKDKGKGKDKDKDKGKDKGKGRGTDTGVPQGEFGGGPQDKDKGKQHGGAGGVLQDDGDSNDFAPATGTSPEEGEKPDKARGPDSGAKPPRRARPDQRTGAAPRGRPAEARAATYSFRSTQTVPAAVVPTEVVLTGVVLGSGLAEAAADRAPASRFWTMTGDGGG